LIKCAEKEAAERIGKDCFKFASYEQRNHVGITAPVTVFPFPAETIADILLGGLAYVSFISLKALAAHIEKRGWLAVDVTDATVQKRILDCPVLHVFKADDFSRNYSLPIDVIIDCAVSLVDIDSVLVAFEQLTEDPGGNWTFVYDDESSLWR